MTRKEELKQQALKRLKETGKLQDEQLDTSELSEKEVRSVLEDLMIHQMELKLQNEHLSSLQMELQKSRDRYYKLYDNAPVGFFTFNKEGVIYELNNAGATLLGKDKESIKKKPFTLYLKYLSHQAFFEHLKKVQETGKKTNCELELKDEKFVEVETIPIENDDDEEQRFMSSMKDVTAKKKAQEKMLKAKDEANRANRAKSNFLANMSHEIRTPLSGITGALDLIETDELSSENMHFLRIAKDSSQVLMETLDNILDYSKIEANKLEFSKEAFDLRKMAEKIINAFQIRARKNNIELSLDWQLPFEYYCDTDAQKLQQILNNLISNAVKNTKSGQVKLVITGSEKKDYLDFTVEDTGIGIDEEELDKLFEEFFQVELKADDKDKGVGLGLAITKRLIELLGGQISVKSEKGEGTAFSFSIPAPSAKAPEESKEKKSLSTKSIKEMKVLVAEDNPVNQVILRKIFERFGCTIDLARNGSQALQKLGESDYDIVFLDIQMPDFDGYEVTERVRKAESKSGHHQKIVGLSAHATTEHKKRSLEAGMDGYLTKPIKSEKILQICREL